MKAVTLTILILATHTGGGHMNQAQALREIFSGQCAARYDVDIAFPQSLMIGHSYGFYTRHATRLLTLQYVVTDSAPASFWLQRAQALADSRRILAMIRRVRPDLIITTHSLISYTTARAVERLAHPLPLVFLLTDLGQVHMSWFSEKHASAYLVPTREIFAQALSAGIEESRLHLTGRPVRRQFYEAAHANKGETLASLGLDPSLFTIYLQGGATGSAGASQAVESLLRSTTPLQILLAAGDNKRLTARYAGHKQVCALPYTPDIAPYMAAADVIAGKAGASSISEAFTLEKPFIATSYIPGQESANLRFIEQHNLGWVCLDPPSLQKLLASLAQTPALLTEKLDSIRAYKTWNSQANEGICPVIDRLLPPSDL